MAFFPPGDVSAQGPGPLEEPAPAAEPAPTEGPEPTVAHPYLLLTERLDALLAAGVLTRETRDGAQWPCWSAVNGFAELAIQGPLRNVPAGQVRQLAERTVDAIIAGICD